LYLPPAPGRHTVSHSEPLVAPAPGGNETILLVEDNAALRRATAQQVTALGYAVLEAEDAASALELLRGPQPVDLLFSDVVMPGDLDGVALARRAAAMRPGIRVLLSSGFPDARSADARSDDVRSVAPGAADDPVETDRLPLLSKPFRQQELARALRDVLDIPAPAYVNA
jgi:CheY-like chemotaxis protein